MQTTKRNQINQSIETSIYCDMRVHFDYEGTQDELLDAIEEMCDYEIDYTTENDGSLDVWATDATGDMVWRLCVTCTQQSNNS